MKVYCGGEVSEEKDMKGELLAKRGPTEGEEEEVAREQKERERGCVTAER